MRANVAEAAEDVKSRGMLCMQGLEEVVQQYLAQEGETEAFYSFWP